MGPLHDPVTWYKIIYTGEQVAQWDFQNKALWIGVSRKNKTEPLKFQCPKDPIKFLGTYLSHDAAANNNNNFYIKIRKMETKLNIWRSRDLTLFGRTMLAKSLGLSQLIYTASMLSVTETVIQQTQSKLFAFLWKNKRDKIKRKVLFFFFFFKLNLFFIYLFFLQTLYTTNRLAPDYLITSVLLTIF